jgi:hypothetical protein
MANKSNWKTNFCGALVAIGSGLAQSHDPRAQVGGQIITALATVAGLVLAADYNGASAGSPTGCDVSVSKCPLVDGPGKTPSVTV